MARAASCGVALAPTTKASVRSKARPSRLVANDGSARPPSLCQEAFPERQGIPPRRAEHGRADPGIARVAPGDPREGVDRGRIVDLAEGERDLEPDADLGGVGQGEDAVAERPGPIEPGLGQSEGVLADARRGVLQGDEEVFIPERLQALQRPERMQPAERFGAPAEELAQGLDGRRVLPLEEEPVGRVAVPGVGVFEQGHQFEGRCPAQPGSGPGSEAGRGESVDAAAVGAAAEVELGLDVVGDRPGVLDRLAVHVEDGQRAVGGVDEVDGAEPGVGRGEELGLLLSGCAVGAEGHAVGLDDHAVDDVVGDLAEEEVPAEGGGNASPR